MPSPGEDIQSWSVTAANNGSADPLINWAEGQTRASVNNSSRSEMAAHAKNRNLLNGSIVTAGTANAQQFLSGVTYTTIPTGLRATLKVGSGLTNTTSMTLNMDGLGDILVKTANGDNLAGGEFVANGYVDLLYNGTNWIFLYGREFMLDRINSGGGIVIGKQIFATAGTFTYTPTPGTECAIIECLGAGGGGAGTPNPSSGGLGGGGGGAGGYSRSFKTAAEIGASQTVIVGAKGAGGTIGGGAGQNGGDSSLGTLCIGKGGGGAAANVGLNSNGGTGGIAGAGDVTGTGEGGEPGLAHIQVLSGISGRGGDTAFGSGGAGITTTTGQHGNAATGYGAGGGGGATYGGFSSTMGGDGSAGLIVILEIAGRGAPGRDGAPGPAGPIGPVGPSGTGTGDVLRFGTPSNTQLAQWTDASHIQGVAASSIVGALAVGNVVLQKFTASGTYTPTSGMKFCIIECIGGGGGGGGTATGAYCGAGGGGAGSYSLKRATAAEIGASKTVTVGAAGGGGTSGPNNGTAGGDTSVGTLCVARGGSGGPGQNAGGSVAGGAGGVAGTGDITGTGQNGHGAPATVAVVPGQGGAGGGTFLGSSGATLFTGSAANGNAATGYGAGGGGAATSNAGAAAGGNGAPGIVIITEFI